MPLSLTCENHFWRPFAGKDEQPCALAAEEAHELLSRSFELSRSISEHDFESAKPQFLKPLKSKTVPKTIPISIHKAELLSSNLNNRFRTHKIFNFLPVTVKPENPTKLQNLLFITYKTLNFPTLFPLHHSSHNSQT